MSSIPESLCSLALNQLNVPAVLVLMKAVSGQMGEQSRGLLAALERSNRKAWKSLEVALAGESLWGRLTTASESRQLQKSVRAFLDRVPLTELDSRPPEFRRKCVRELREALGKGVLLGNLVAGELVEKTSKFAAHSDPALSLIHI